jgi:hypothetical protein
MNMICGQAKQSRAGSHQQGEAVGKELCCAPLVMVPQKWIKDDSMIRGVSQIKKRGKKPSVMAFMTASQPNCKNTYTYT